MTYAIATLPLPSTDEAVDLVINSHKETVGFKPEFVNDDGILREVYLREHGEDDIYHGHAPSEKRFSSVRRFWLSQKEKVTIHDGEIWTGQVEGWTASERQSKDDRTIVHVTVHNLRRRYSSSIERDGGRLFVSLRSGEHLVQRKEIFLKEYPYRFREEGGREGVIVEILALGTEQRPVALVDSPRQTTFEDLVKKEAEGFGKLNSAAVKAAAGKMISATIRTVNRETLEGFRNLPRMGRSEYPSKVLARR